MNNDEAKFILSAYRPGGDDAADARFTDAVAQAERDPELTAWFKSELQFDAAIADALDAVPPPRDLRAKILAGGEASRPRAWSARRTVLALAAGIVLLAALASIWLGRAPGLDGWQRDALAIIPKFGTGAENFDLANNDPEVLRQFLRARNAPAPATLPVALQSLPALGCKTITSSGQAVSIMCFKMHTGDFIHLVMTGQNTLSHPPPAKPRFVEENGWTTASWSANGQSCMLATKGSEKDLREVLTTAALAAVRVERFVRASIRPLLAEAQFRPLP
ncbi:MAG: hypothetical protein ABI946_02820 [Chthoniobacterales bacterium]